MKEANLCDLPKVLCGFHLRRVFRLPRPEPDQAGHDDGAEPAVEVLDPLGHGLQEFEGVGLPDVRVGDAGELAVRGREELAL